jgi:hypothetical protein
MLTGNDVAAYPMHLISAASNAADASNEHQSS